MAAGFSAPHTLPHPGPTHLSSPPPTLAAAMAPHQAYDAATGQFITTPSAEMPGGGHYHDVDLNGGGKKDVEGGPYHGDSFTRDEHRRIDKQGTLLPERELEAQRHGTWVEGVFHIITAVIGEPSPFCALMCLMSPPPMNFWEQPARLPPRRACACVRCPAPGHAGKLRFWATASVKAQLAPASGTLAVTLAPVAAALWPCTRRLPRAQRPRLPLPVHPAGSGVLYLPFFFSILGWVGGIIMVLLFGAITW